VGGRRLTLVLIELLVASFVLRLLCLLQTVFGYPIPQHPIQLAVYQRILLFSLTKSKKGINIPLSIGPTFIEIAGMLTVAAAINKAGVLFI
jgi:hypothetical protein